MKFNSSQRPPRLAEWFLQIMLSPRDRDMLLGDFEEFYVHCCTENSRRKANAWYWRQAMKSIPHFIREHFYWRNIMLGNHVKMTLRTMLKHRGFTAINILGLSMGLACCLVMLLYVHHEQTYDQHHPFQDRLYRIVEYRKVPVGEFVTVTVSMPIAPILKADYPEVEETARLMPTSNVLVEGESVKAFEHRVFYAESDCFEVFGIPFIHGTAQGALDAPSNVVLTESMAKKYFGKTDIVGERLILKDPTIERYGIDNPIQVYTVSAVVADPPSNTHLKYSILLPLMQFNDHWVIQEWHAGPVFTYVRLKAGVDQAGFEEKIKRMAYTYVGEEFSVWKQTREYHLQPLSDIHYASRFRGQPIRNNLEAPTNRNYLVIYSTIALLILLVGCMNFINLSNARAVGRIKEVGLRKVIGASQAQLMRQFLGEAVFITTVAAVLSLGLAKALLPLFNDFAGTTLTLSQLLHPTVALAMAALIVVVGGLSGLYPALVLSRFKPDQILRGTHSGARGAFLLKVLVVGQFAISIFLAVCGVTVHGQLNYLRSGRLGYDITRKYVIPFRYNEEVVKKAKFICSEFERVPGVNGATASSGLPGGELPRNALAQSDSKTAGGKLFYFLSCDDHFLDDYQIPLVAGRPFDRALNDEKGAFLLNESAVAFLGYASPEEALGQRYHESWYGKWKTIVGVVADVYFFGLGQEIGPMYMEYSSSRFQLVTLVLAPGSLTQTLKAVQAKWEDLFPEIPFSGFFLDQYFARLYQRELQMGKLLHLLTGMGLLSACLGLLGLVSFMVHHRLKEIGIRKTLGASIGGLVTLLSRRFFILILLANVIALPVAYWIAQIWLQSYPNRISLDWRLFALPGVAALALGILPVAIRSWGAARINPVKTLKQE